MLKVCLMIAAVPVAVPIALATIWVRDRWRAALRRARYEE